MIDKNFITDAKNLAQDFFMNCSKDDNIIFVGGGYALFWYNKLFLKRGISPKFIVDNNKSKWGTTLFNIPVGSFDDVKKIFDLAHLKIVVSAPKYKHELLAQTKEKFGNVPIYSFESEIYCDFCRDIESYRKYLLDNYDKLTWLYSNLADEKSKLVLDNVLKGRLTANQDYFIEIMDPNQYFPADIIKFKSNEVIVELGSHDGRTLLELLEKINRQYKEIFCFEPDKEALTLLKKKITSEKNRGGGGLLMLSKKQPAPKTVLFRFSVMQITAFQKLPKMPTLHIK